MLLARIKSRVKRYLLERWDLQIPLSFGTASFAQEGEDVLLCRIIQSTNSGSAVYVDVGCNHPFRMSNTGMLYRRGWSGIAIDPNPEFATSFANLRPRDVFVNCGVSSSNGILHYFQFEESLYNTFDSAKAKTVGTLHSPLVRKLDVPIRRLDEILYDHWPEGKRIQFLSVDCEGFDLKVLSSHDFDRYKTDLIFAECFGCSIRETLNSPMISYLESKNYEFISKLANSCLFVNRNVMDEYGLA